MPKETKQPKPTAETRVADPDAAFERLEQMTRKILRVPKESIQPKDNRQPS